MTDAQHLAWDAVQEAIREALVAVDTLRAQVGDGHEKIAAHNRLVMAGDALEQAMDYAAAARSRMPE